MKSHFNCSIQKLFHLFSSWKQSCFPGFSLRSFFYTYIIDECEKEIAIKNKNEQTFEIEIGREIT